MPETNPPAVLTDDPPLRDEHGEPEKRCPGCKEPKPLSEFYNSSRTKDGKTPYCKKCTNAINTTNRRRRMRDPKYAERKRARDAASARARWKDPDWRAEFYRKRNIRRRAARQSRRKGAEDNNASERREAAGWLRSFLAGSGETGSATVKDAAKAEGHSPRTLARARQELGVVVRHSGMSTVWSLPGEE